MPERFESWSQNCEDVVLWRTLRDVEAGVYVEVGANDPSHYSVTKGFYDIGWRGMIVEPTHHLAELHRTTRPGDIQIEAAVSSSAPEPVMLHEIDDTGLSTVVDDVSRRHANAGWAVHDVEVPTVRLDDVLAEAGFDQIHFMSVDVEGAEDDVLTTLDLRRFRPWVLVVESTAPLERRQTFDGWEPLVLGAGYEFCLFDGLSRFYVAEEHADRLRDLLSYPACVFDNFRDSVQRGLDTEVATLRTDVEAMTHDAIRWRATALQRWSDVLSTANNEQTAQLQAQIDHLHAEIKAIHRTVSWRVTTPLRAAHTRGLGR